MLRWVLIFLVLALVAALLGFGGLAAGFAEIAKIIVRAPKIVNIVPKR